jgi:hypothetical protein
MVVSEMRSAFPDRGSMRVKMRASTMPFDKPHPHPRPNQHSHARNVTIPIGCDTFLTIMIARIYLYSQSWSSDHVGTRGRELNPIIQSFVPDTIVCT